jgi:hypothetical protein
MFGPPRPGLSGLHCRAGPDRLEPRRRWPGAWLSLVERLLWEQDVGGSNPLAPTTPSGPGRI